MNSCSLSVDIALFSSLGWISYSCRLLGRYCVLLLLTHSLPLPGSCPLSGKCYTLVFFRTVVISWDYTLVLFRLDILGLCAYYASIPEWMKCIFFLVPDLQTVETIALEKGRDTEYAIQRYVLVFYANRGNPHYKRKL